MTSRSLRKSRTGIVAGVLCFAALSCASHPSPVIRPEHYSAADMGRYYAVVIGNSVYTDTHWDRLDAADQDARELSRVLRESYGYEVYPLYNATRTETLQALGGLSRLKESDRVLIYYSGHGERSEAGKAGFWIPVDASSDLLNQRTTDGQSREQAAGWIGRADVVGQLVQLRPSHVLVIDDSCFSAAVKHTNTSEQAITPSNVARASQSPPSDVRLARVQMDRAIPPAEVHAETAVKALLSKGVRNWMSASGESESAWASRNGALSRFTSHLVQVLEENEGVMDGTEVFEKIRKGMVSAYEPESTELSTDELQMPEYLPVARAVNTGGDFLFARKTWSVDEVDLDIGNITVAHADSDSSSRGESVDYATYVKLVHDQLLDTNDPSHVYRPGGRPRHLYLVVSIRRSNTLILTLIDRDTDQLLGRVTQVLSRDSEELRANVKSAVLTLRSRAEDELVGKEISADIVKRALVAQRRHTWNAYVATGVSGFLSLDSEGWLNKPAFDFRLGVDHTVVSWFLVGAALGFQTTKAESGHQLFVGDVDSGTHANNKFVGQLTMHTFGAMIRATLRRSHGLILPFGYIGAGLAYHDLNMGDEHLVGAMPSDTLALNVINRRDDASAWALAMESGAGLNFLLSEHFSLMGQGNLFKSFHRMKIRSLVEGLAQEKPVFSDFQSIQGVTLLMGVAWFM